MIIRCKNIYAEDGVMDGYMVVEGSKIKAISAKQEDLAADIDVGEAKIIPGIFDTHNHGIYGYHVAISVPDVELELKGYLKGLAAQGVTSVLPTDDSGVFADLARLAREPQDGAKIIGIHSEGPYLNRSGENGGEDPHPDVDMEFVRKMVEDSDGMLKLVALAPEIPGTDEVIAYLLARDIRVAFAHSNDDYYQTMEAFNKGLTVATHTANVMSGIHHRRMGGLGACLLNDDVWCEVICDGMHVSNVMLKLMFKVKSYDKFLMVSDTSVTSGAPTGRYVYYTDGSAVNVKEDGFCLSDSGRLCCSTKPVLYGMGNLVKNVSIPLETVVRMASLNPAICYGVADTKGSIKVGKDADFVVIDEDFNALQTYSEGRKVYDHEVDHDPFNPVFIKNHMVK